MNGSAAAAIRAAKYTAAYQEANIRQTAGEGGELPMPIRPFFGTEVTFFNDDFSD